MRKLLLLAEQGFTVLSLMIYTGGPLTVILSGGASEGEAAFTDANDNSLIKLILLLNYLISFFLLIIRWKKVLCMLSKDRFIWVIVGFAVASILWSYSPDKTLARVLALVGTTLFGLYLTTRYTLKQQLQLLGWMFCLVIVLSFIFGLALRQYGIMGGVHVGAWRGIYNHKNVLGKMMIMSASIFLILAIGTKKNRLFLWCGFGISLILVLLSRSSSALLNFIIILTAFFVFRTLRWRYELMIPGLIVLAMVGGSLFLGITDNADALLGSVGKDATLTGRTDLWPLVIGELLKRPWLGYGYGGFWYGWDSAASDVWYASGWNPPNSHNGLLDLAIQLGMIGVFIFGLGFLTFSVPRALIWVRQSRTSDGFWPSLFLVNFVLANLTESTLMLQNDIFWVLYVAINYTILMPPERNVEILRQPK